MAGDGDPYCEVDDEDVILRIFNFGFGVLCIVEGSAVWVDLFFFPPFSVFVLDVFVCGKLSVDEFV